MKSAKAMAGQPVILEGRRIGRVLQVELSEDLTAMTGLWADCGLKGTRYMTDEQIQLLGDVAVIVKEMGKRRRLGAVSYTHLDVYKRQLVVINFCGG